MSRVIDALIELHTAIGMEYMRDGLKIHLEPDAFYRLSNELVGKSAIAPVAGEGYIKYEIEMRSSMGIFHVIKDVNLDNSRPLSIQSFIWGDQS